MTEKEAVNLIKKIYIDTYQSERRLALKMAISALFNKQEYRSIGTAEECREAVERNKAKKPVKYDNCGNKCAPDRCPNCFEIVSGKNCENCGQAILWEESEEEDE